MSFIDDDHTLYVKRVELKRNEVPSFRTYPFSLDAIRSLEHLELRKPVTFIVGENGTGKSTLLEGIAVACGFNPEGGSKNFNFSTVSTHSELHHYLRIGRGVKRERDGFFLRAESYYNVASEIDLMDREGGGPSLKNSYGGKSLHEQSHGESFFATFIHRFRGLGLYLMDEPEAALSPLRQMSLLVRMHELINHHSQFIIATHSPILMSYPEAEIYLLNEDGVNITRLEDTDHYTITKSFLNNRERMIQELFAETLDKE